MVVKDGYNNEEVRRLTIDDIAGKEQNDRDHAEFREHFSELDHRVDSLDSRVDKVGAGAAALAALHPMDFDPDDKLTFAAGYGNYKGKNAAAVGAFYRPDEKVMLSVGGTFGNGENMVNAGISFSLDRTARVSNSRTAMAKEIVDLRANVANLTALVGQLTAGMGGTIEMDRMKLFPDVPENHWAYEYIGRLAAAGIVEGYPDGMFNGNRMMSRYEFAAMLYRALEKGVKLDHKLVREFEPVFYTVFCLIPALEHVLNNFLIGFAALLLVVTEVVVSVVGGVVGVVEVIVAAFVAAVVVAVAIVQGERDLFCVGIGLCVHD